MRYTEFLDIIRFNRLTLRYPGLWPDKLEALFLKCFENGTELNRLSSVYLGKRTDYSAYDVKSDLKILSSLLIKFRCQCWTYKEDDLVMWNERNSQETVRICVNKQNLDKYEKACYDGKIIHRDVSYCPKVSIDPLLDIFMKNRMVPELILMKKDVFSYEDEHRLMFMPNDYSFHTSSYGNTLSECLQRHFYGIKAEFNMLVNTRNKISHVKSLQNKKCLDGVQCAFYIAKSSLIYRKMIFILIGIDTELYNENIINAVNAWDKWYYENK